GIILMFSGFLLIAYSPFLFEIMADQGQFILMAFDVSLLLLLPALLYFFEQIFGPGYRSIVKYIRKFQFVYSGICLLVVAGNHLYPAVFSGAYFFTTVTIMNLLLFVEFA